MNYIRQIAVLMSLGLTLIVIGSGCAKKETASTPSVSDPVGAPAPTQSAGFLNPNFPKIP